MSWTFSRGRPRPVKNRLGICGSKEGKGGGIAGRSTWGGEAAAAVADLVLDMALPESKRSWVKRAQGDTLIEEHTYIENARNEGGYRMQSHNWDSLPQGSNCEKNKVFSNSDLFLSQRGYIRVNANLHAI